LKSVVTFHPKAWDQYLYWQKQNKKLVTRINELLKNISRNPFEGIGKPEPLRGNLKGYWSRRIDQEHRLVYKIEKKDSLIAVQCRFHY